MTPERAKSSLTKYMDYCLICGKPRQATHHILSGIANRKLSDNDRITMPLCYEHHTGKRGIHTIREFEVLAKIIGQLAWEKNRIATELSKYKALENPTGKDWNKNMPIFYEQICDEAREAFRQRYGKSLL
ncbi:MAG: hypothetical protein IKN54_04715 [Lachnospiraceae bacterium]|nr:hypothetical protein [Lachnospiraceae bacterium]